MPNHHSAKRLVIIETPYTGDMHAQLDYAKACMKDSLLRGEAPIAGHLLYPQPGILDDQSPDEQELWLTSRLAWANAAHLSAVYVDRGISPGMEQGIAAALNAGVPVSFRNIEPFAEHIDETHL